MHSLVIKIKTGLVLVQYLLNSNAIWTRERGLGCVPILKANTVVNKKSNTIQNHNVVSLK